MNCEAAIYGILSVDATLTGLLATTKSIYPEIAPQGANNPCVVYVETTSEFSDSKSGVSKLDTNLIQIDIYADTIAERNVIGDRIRVLLDRYTGEVGGIKIQSIQLVYSLKLYDGESRAYRQTMDYKIRQKIT